MNKGWLELKENGPVWGMQIVVWVCKILGRTPAHLLTACIVFYYSLFAFNARKASRDYLKRMGLSHGFLDVYRHMRTFAYCVVDRIFFLSGQQHLFQINRNGSHHLDALQNKKQGAILLGAHLGSFEALRACDRPIHVVGYFANAKKINAILQSINPRNTVRLIEITPTSVDFILAIRDKIAQGDFVAILGDRTMPGIRTTQVDFLGAPAHFPTGAFLLASLVECPVLLTFGLYKGTNRYDLYCEPFADRIVLPRKDRDTACQAYVQQYAQRLAHYCQEAPQNWFNFYDFWSPKQ